MMAARDDLLAELIAARRAGQLSPEGGDLLAAKVGKSAADIIAAEFSRPKFKRELNEIIRNRYRELIHAGKNQTQATIILYDEGFDPKRVDRVVIKGVG